MADTNDLFNELEGIENDNDLTPDNDNLGDDDVGDGDAELEEIFAQLKAGGKVDDEEDLDDEPEDGKAAPEDDEEARFQQKLTEELNRIIPQRLARDRKTQQVQELEALTGMSLDQIKAQVIQNAILDTADKMGISEEEAKEIVAQRFENAGLKAEKQTKAQEEAELSAAMQQVEYMKTKTEYTRQPRLSRILTPEVIAQIDKFTQNGTILSFKDGVKYVLGEKLIEGELLNKMQTGAENKAKRTAATGGGKTTPKGGGGSSKSDAVSLSRQERILAAQLGVNPKDWGTEKISIQKSKQRKSR